MSVKVRMPNGADERVIPDTVLVMRNALSFEKRENPQILTSIWTGSTRIYPAEALDKLKVKFSLAIKLADLMAPNGAKLLVSMARVVEADDPGDEFAKSAKTLLKFGVGVPAPRQAVRQTAVELRALWQAAGVATDPFD